NDTSRVVCADAETGNLPRQASPNIPKRKRHTPERIGNHTRPRVSVCAPSHKRLDSIPFPPRGASISFHHHAFMDNESPSISTASPHTATRMWKHHPSSPAQSFPSHCPRKPSAPQKNLEQKTTKVRKYLLAL